MNKMKRLIPLLLLVCALLSVNLTALAAEELPQTDRKGSINVTVRDTETNESVKGGCLKICQVAAVSVNDWNFSYTYTDAFAKCGQPLNDIASEDLADALAQYALENNMKMAEEKAGADGCTTFSNLSLGLYLVMQGEAADGYESIRPFLISVPMKEGQSLVYDVDASPKGITVDRKTVESGEDISGNEPDANDPGQKTVSKTPVKSNENTENKLPQTGQLWWPVLVLAAAGAVFFGIGWSRRRSC